MRAPAWARDALAGASLVALAYALHASLPYFFDGDTAYHLVVARLLREHGVLQAFPWTPWSYLADRYADKELLFHVLLLPVAHWPPEVAARLAGTVLGAFLLGTFYLLLRRSAVPHAWLWTLVPLASSSAFVARFASVRPHLLSIALALLVTDAAARGRARALAVLGFLFPLCYTAWHLPLALFALAALGRRLAGQPFDRTGALALAAGLGAGILVHPNFPNTLGLFWVQNVEVLVRRAWGDAAGFDLGGEFQPFSARGLLRYVLWPAALAAAGLVVAWRRRRADAVTVSAALAACAMLLLTLRTQRFIEYLAPFAAWAAALALRPVPGVAVLGGLALGLAFMARFATYPLELLATREPAFPDPAPRLLQAAVPEHAQVVTCDWRHTGESMLALPGRRFVVALDPVFFHVRHPGEYRLWFHTMRQPGERPARVLREGLGADFVLCLAEPRWRPVLAALGRDPDARLQSVLGPWRLFDVRARAP